MTKPDDLGLKINMEKKKLMRINAKNHELIMIAGQGTAEVHELAYLGATVCKEGDGMKHLKNRLSKAKSAFRSDERGSGAQKHSSDKNEPEAV